MAKKRLRKVAKRLKKAGVTIEELQNYSFKMLRRIRVIGSLISEMRKNG